MKSDIEWERHLNGCVKECQREYGGCMGTVLLGKRLEGISGNKGTESVRAILSNKAVCLFT